MDWGKRTIETYDKSAEALAQYFKDVGARTEDIERGLSLAHADNGKAKVLEIGCGDGRDAAEIVQRVAWYEGFDPSKGLINIAKERLPKASFIIADALSYEYPQGIDVIYAFASLLHINKTDLIKVIEKASQALRTKGILYISLKEKDTYTEQVRRDDHGERMFYYYSVDFIKNATNSLFNCVYVDRQTRGDSEWFTMALQKL